MQRNNLILVVFFSFLGVVLAHEKIIKVQVITDDEQEEHPGSVYRNNSGFKKLNLTTLFKMGLPFLPVHVLGIYKVQQRFPIIKISLWNQHQMGIE